MRRRLAVFAGVVVAAGGLAFVPAAGAHPGHGSCADGAHTFVPPEEPGLIGGLASELAQSGAMHDFEAGLHAALCDPAP